MKYAADDLKISQIPQLLDEYKRLALENLQLKKSLQQARNSNPNNYNNTNTTNTNVNSEMYNGITVIPPIILTPTVVDQTSLLG